MIEIGRRFAIFFGIFVVYFVSETLIFVQNRNRWNSYKTVTAKITKSRFHNYNEPKDSGYGLNRSFETELEFTYEYQGETYSSTTPALKPPQLFTFHDFEYDLFTKYKEGDVTEARLDPEKPEKAYLAIAPLDKLGLATIAAILIAIPICYELLIIFLTWFVKDTGPGDWWYRP